MKTLNPENKATVLGGNIIPKSTTLAPFQKPYFRDKKYETPYDAESELTRVNQALEPFNGSEIKFNRRHDALIKSILRQENKFKVTDKLNETISEQAQSLRKVRQKYRKGEGAELFEIFFHSETIFCLYMFYYKSY